jgi:hypothetical protein
MESFVPQRLPLLENLRRDPYERTEQTSNTYFEMIQSIVAALEKDMPGPAPRAKRVQWVFPAGCVGMPHHLTRIIWVALNPVTSP